MVGVGCRNLTGSPAHAGIDPFEQPGAVLLDRFPRPRGDRPSYDVLVWYRETVPPPTRG